MEHSKCSGHSHSHSHSQDNQDINMMNDLELNSNGIMSQSNRKKLTQMLYAVTSVVLVNTGTLIEHYVNNN